MEIYKIHAANSQEIFIFVPYNTPQKKKNAFPFPFINIFISFSLALHDQEEYITIKAENEYNT